MFPRICHPGELVRNEYFQTTLSNNLFVMVLQSPIKYHSDSGHVGNLKSFDELLSVVRGFPVGYNPSKNEFQIYPQ
jgi:hypothetical protein